MNTIKQRYPIKKTKGHVLWSVLFLLSLYVVGTVEIESFHSLIHDSHAELHSPEKEKDACHQSIYHQAEEDCGHKSHLIEVNKCPFCQVSAPSFHFPVKEVIYEVVQIKPVYTTHLYFTTSAFTLARIPARAPPIFS